MALAAPEVVALSTLNLDPVEPQDNLVVIIAPAPDDEEGNLVMNQLLQEEQNDDSLTTKESSFIRQPVVVFNPHMAPIQGPAASYEVAYQMRLLSVQFMASSSNPGQGFVPSPKQQQQQQQQMTPEPVEDEDDEEDVIDDSDEALQAALEHARRINRPDGGAPGGSNSSNDTNNVVKGGTTRAMIIRAYPNPWHVFVDTSPDTDADFTIAGTYDEAPTPDDIQMSIMECLEGSEREDEIVAQQMQQALETGQLDRVSEMLGDMGLDIFDEDFDEDEDDEDDPWGLYGVDTV
eukprot:CAMPEP_0172445156 /NCGR_PEP_ID=MMETSP1065-20121228/5082_1 /TAXON_ID=265537 /ORGANISM="Amphiprora paludosa, Strain CCMP125" /LENGTH=290 /DNA_ID=CAMNT_0013195953 /DNA_START=85 /DNA_END=957 /DNA_ORIENTATION=-